MLAKAKTGTGKTLAFLIPIAEHLVNSAPPVSAGDLLLTAVAVLVCWAIALPLLIVAVHHASGQQHTTHGCRGL